MDKKKIAQVKKILLEMKDSLINELNSKIADPDITASISEAGDEADIASQFQTQQFGQIMNDRDSQKLSKIEKALDKIAKNEYGICEECGDPISEKRITAMPFATLCVDCQENAESEKSIQRDDSFDLDGASESDEVEKEE